MVWRYRIERDEAKPKAQEVKAPGTPERRQTTTLRIVRDTAMSRKLKIDYGYACQVCGLAIATKSGPYAEAAHIKPLGRPHNGPVVRSNIICLCPNHHVMFDAWMFSIADDFALLGTDGTLTVKLGHDIDLTMLAYHRSRYLDE